MRIIRFVDGHGRECLGTDFAADTAELLAGDLFGELRRTGHRVGVQRLLAPISPPNIFGIGLNYREHVRLLGNTNMPEHPVAFMKPTTSIAHPGQPILLPAYRMNGPEVDYECELAVIIGRTARDVAEHQAMSYVFGYTAQPTTSPRETGPSHLERVARVSTDSAR